MGVEGHTTITLMIEQISGTNELGHYFTGCEIDHALREVDDILWRWQSYRPLCRHSKILSLFIRNTGLFRLNKEVAKKGVFLPTTKPTTNRLFIRKSVK
jgi:hypothetical protein